VSRFIHREFILKRFHEPLRRAWQCIGASPSCWLRLLAIVALVTQTACTSTMRYGTPGRFSYDTTVNATCRNNPAACAPAPGEEPLIFNTLKEAGTAALSAGAVLRVLETATQTAIENALVKCANDARSDILLRHEGKFRTVFPAADECAQMTVDAQGRKVRWAIRLGNEMHDEARKCAERVLGSLWPGGFSLEQRYRYDMQTGRKKLVSTEEEKLLEETGNGGELAGTLKPDLVLHSGDPLRAQAVYDFKFPCVNTDRPVPWSKYPEGSPYAGRDQGEMYKELFEQRPARIMPRLGLLR
jgi:hypothetical protein